MKTLKLIIATIAISGFASTASAEVPVHVQERLQELEHLKRGQGQVKAQKAGSATDKETSGNVHEDESEDAKGKRAEKGKRAKADRDKAGKKGQKADKPQKTKSDKPAKTSDKARAPKPNEESAGEEGLDAHEKEERKHLRRLAQFERLEQVAARNGNDRLSEKVSMLREKEARRHERAVERLAARTI